MRRIECVCVVFVSLLVPCAAAAQDDLHSPANQVPVASSQLQASSLQLPASLDQQPVATRQLPALVDHRPSTTGPRPRVLLPLYAGFAAVQLGDYLTTTHALANGAGREANPLMGGIVNNRPAFIAVKAATTAGVIWASEKLWKKNRVGAIVLMAVADGVMGAIVVHNQEIGGRR